MGSPSLFLSGKMRSSKQQGTGVLIWTILSVSIALAYIAAGIFLLLARETVQVLSPNMQLLLSIGLILYGVFRVYRSYRRYTSVSEEEPHES
jgi:hypothetical protein